MVRPHQGDAVGEGRAAAAGQRVHALARHGDGLGGRQQHLGAVPAEGDHADLVPRSVALLQQRQRRSLLGTAASGFAKGFAVLARLLQYMLRAWVLQCVALLQQRQRYFGCRGGESKRRCRACTSYLQA